MWKAENDGAWITIEHDTFITVCPITDIRSHDLESLACSCAAEIESGDERGAYTKPTVVHNRHEDLDKMRESLETIYGSD